MKTAIENHLAKQIDEMTTRITCHTDNLRNHDDLNEYQIVQICREIVSNHEMKQTFERQLQIAETAINQKARNID
jgi:hypothetical protein